MGRCAAGGSPVSALQEAEAIVAGRVAAAAAAAAESRKVVDWTRLPGARSARSPPPNPRVSFGEPPGAEAVARPRAERTTSPARTASIIARCCCAPVAAPRGTQLNAC